MDVGAGNRSLSLSRRGSAWLFGRRSFSRAGDLDLLGACFITNASSAWAFHPRGRCGSGFGGGSVVGLRNVWLSRLQSRLGRCSWTLEWLVIRIVRDRSNGLISRVRRLNRRLELALVRITELKIKARDIQ